MPDQTLQLTAQRFQKRYHLKKTVNLLISAVIFLLGFSSVIFIWNYDGDGLLTFRWMTVDGTIFTSAIALIYVAVNLIEIRKYTELTSRTVYYMRLASAVAESLILMVVLLSQLPFSPQKLHIFRHLPSI